MENKDYQVLVVGDGFIGDAQARLISAIHDRLGEDLIVVTAEEAKERGILINGTPDIKPFPLIDNHPALVPIEWDFKDGKQNRRERRAQQRKNKK